VICIPCARHTSSAFQHQPRSARSLRTQAKGLEALRSTPFAVPLG
jgi:hypothetical protein